MTMREQIMANTSKKKKLRASDFGVNLSRSHPSPLRCRSAQDGGQTAKVLSDFASAQCSKSLMHSPVSRASFGSPSYPSPLDCIRTGKLDRAQQLGVSIAHNSFDANQSYPKAIRPNHKTDLLPDSTPEVRKKLADFKGEGLNDVSFGSRSFHGSFATQDEVADSWTFFNSVGGAGGPQLPHSVRNPNKCIMTVNAKTSEILVANQMACELFGFCREELLGLQLNDLVTLKSKGSTTVSETYLEDNGQLIEVSGRVMDAIDSSGLVVPISLWVRRLDTSEPRCLVVMEPVDRYSAVLTFDSTGKVIECDKDLALLHGYSCPGDIKGLAVNALIPSLKLPPPGRAIPKDVKKQRATGRTKHGQPFPLSVLIQPQTHLDAEAEDEVYKGEVWVFANVSGLITILPNGQIHSINDNFALMLFGYRKEELIGCDISTIIPQFFENFEEEELDFPIPPLDDDDDPRRLLNQSGASNGTDPSQATHTVTCGAIVSAVGKLDEIQSEDEDEVFESNQKLTNTSKIADQLEVTVANPADVSPAAKPADLSNHADASGLDVSLSKFMSVHDDSHNTSVTSEDAMITVDEWKRNSAEDSPFKIP
ncbi:hypothetical protein CAPTEDRAFT_201682, partial [Capitella teleta]